jgi:hypothetical protein
MNWSKENEPKSEDLRHGTTGVVMVPENFAAISPQKKLDGPQGVSPDVGHGPVGQATHE